MKMMFLVRFLLASTLTFCFAMFPFGSALLPKDEVQALRDIAKTLGKTDWNFSVDPCSGQYGWVKLNQPKGFFDNAVTCNNCSFPNDTVCHVISIVLKGQNLTGTLPLDLARFPFLQTIDLTRNYLNGSIPLEWGSTQLVDISLPGNQLTGSIPKELANIKTLKKLGVEFNQLSGNLPPELGDMPSIERFYINSNYFTGELPDSFARLITLKDFRISDNQFFGKIPNYIQNWTNLTKLRISDLNGSEEPFPPLDNLTKLEILILRSCNITGHLPEYLGNMAALKMLDLSFNKLSGKIPSSFDNLQRVDHIYLTGNLLTGQVPSWMLKSHKHIDLSYNKFTESSCASSSNVNLFASFLIGNNSGLAPCLRNFRCLPQSCAFQFCDKDCEDQPVSFVTHGIT